MIPEVLLNTFKKQQTQCSLVKFLLQEHPGLDRVDDALSKEKLSCVRRAVLLADIWALVERARKESGHGGAA